MSYKGYLTILLTICSLSIWPGKCVGNQVNAFEYEVKSACILNFLKFMDLAFEETPDKSGTINIALVGESSAVEIIQKTMHNKTSDNKHIIINIYPDVKHLLEDNRMYHVVYFVAPQSADLIATLPSLGKVARLTISEIPDFCQNGGIINFRIDKGKIRFDINPVAAKKAKIKIRAQLLKLANIIEQPPVPNETPKQNLKKQ